LLKRAATVARFSLLATQFRVPMSAKLVTIAFVRPGQEIIDKGIADLIADRETVESLLVSIGSPRLGRVGIEVPENIIGDAEHRLYWMLNDEFGDAAHSRYNALIRRLVSFERTAKCEV
jgi:hypothetical protein